MVPGHRDRVDCPHFNWDVTEVVLTKEVSVQLRSYQCPGRYSDDRMDERRASEDQKCRRVGDRNAPTQRQLLNPVTIWVVRVGDDLYVRSYEGRGGAWMGSETVFFFDFWWSRT